VATISEQKEWMTVAAYLRAIGALCALALVIGTGPGSAHEPEAATIPASGGHQVALTTPLVHFLLGAAGALAVFLVAARLSGAAGFSFPSAVLVVGINCAVLAHFVTPWATPLVLALSAVATVYEMKRERTDAAQRRRDTGAP
jgi:hypothetical protein